MSAALVFIVQTLLTLTLFVFLLRLLLQLARADFRNQISQAVVRLTNPLILPLRRVLPAMGKVDTASVVAVIIVAFIKITIVHLLVRGFYVPSPLSWAQAVVLEILRITLWMYFWSIFFYALLSLIAPGGYSPVQALLTSLCEPVLRPIRRLIPSVAGLDLSPLWAGIAIQALLILLPNPMLFV